MSKSTPARVVDDLLNNPQQDADGICKILLKLSGSAAFVADVTLPATQFTAHTMPAEVVACRMLWLKHWKADTASKINQATAGFRDCKLFGEDTLKDILFESKHKWKVLVKQEKKKHCSRCYSHYQSTVSFGTIAPRTDNATTDQSIPGTNLAMPLSPCKAVILDPPPHPAITPINRTLATTRQVGGAD